MAHTRWRRAIHDGILGLAGVDPGWVGGGEGVEPESPSMPPVSEVEVLEVDDSASLLAAPRLRRVGGGTSGAPRGDLESFNGKFREYCLDLHWFATIGDARETIETWRIHYNTRELRAMSEWLDQHCELLDGSWMTYIVAHAKTLDAMRCRRSLRFDVHF